MPDRLINRVRTNIASTNSDKKAIVFSTSAGLQNAYGVLSIGKKLISKGYKLMDTPTFEMPRNYYIDKYDPTPAEKQEAQFHTTSQMITQSIAKIESAEEHRGTQGTRTSVR